MLSLGIQQPAAAQDVDLRWLRNPLQDPRGQLPPSWITFPRTCGTPRGCSRPKRFGGTNALAKIERTIGVPVLIETVETLKGETIDEVATRLAQRQPGCLHSDRTRRRRSRCWPLAVTPRRCRTGARQGCSAFIEGFRKKNFDDGLREGIAALDTELASTGAKASCPGREAREPGRIPDASLSSAVAGGLSTRSVRGHAWSFARRSPGAGRRKTAW